MVHAFGPLHPVVVALVAASLAAAGCTRSLGTASTTGRERQLYFALADKAETTLYGALPEAMVGATHRFTATRVEEECDGVPSLHGGCPGGKTYRMPLTVDEVVCTPDTNARAIIEPATNGSTIAVTALAGDSVTITISGRIEDGREFEDSLTMAIVPRPDAIEVKRVENGALVPGDIGASAITLGVQEQIVVEAFALASGRIVHQPIAGEIDGGLVELRVESSRVREDTAVRFRGLKPGRATLTLSVGDVRRTVPVEVRAIETSFEGPKDAAGARFGLTAYCVPATQRAEVPSPVRELHVVRAEGPASPGGRIDVTFAIGAVPTVLVLESATPAQWRLFVGRRDTIERVFINGPDATLFAPLDGIDVQRGDAGKDLTATVANAERAARAKVTTLQACATTSSFSVNRLRPPKSR